MTGDQNIDCSPDLLYPFLIRRAFETTNVDDLGTVFTREASELSGPLFNDRATMVSDPFTIDDCKSNPFPICCTYHIGTGCLKTTVQKQGTNWMDVTGKKVDPANLLDMHSCDQHQGSRVCKAVIFYGNSIKSVSDRSLEGGSHLKQMG